MCSSNCNLAFLWWSWSCEFLLTLRLFSYYRVVFLWIITLFPVSAVLGIICTTDDDEPSSLGHRSCLLSERLFLCSHGVQASGIVPGGEVDSWRSTVHFVMCWLVSFDFLKMSYKEVLVFEEEPFKTHPQVCIWVTQIMSVSLSWASGARTSSCGILKDI